MCCTVLPKILRSSTLAPNRTETTSHLLGVCSATDAEQNGILLGLPPAATVGEGIPAVRVDASRAAAVAADRSAACVCHASATGSKCLTCVRDIDIRLWHCGTRVGLARHLLEKPIGVFSMCLRRVPPTRRTLTRSVSNKTFIRPLCRTNVQGVRRMMCHLDFQKYEQHDCDAPIPQAAHGKNKQHLFYLFLP